MRWFPLNLPYPSLTHERPSPCKVKPEHHPPAMPTTETSPARRLIDSVLVWDHHACMPLRPHDMSFMPQLSRHLAAGFNAVNLNVGFGEQTPEQHMAMLMAMRAWLADRPDEYLLVRTAGDIELARQSGRLAVAFDIEGLNAIGDRIDRVQTYYDLGVRWMLLAYNTPNRAAGGCQAVDEGLTAFGREVVLEMERVGMQVCLSHTGHRTAREVLAMASRPVIFSHSNCAALHPHPRNIPDDLIRACAQTGGVVGINGVGVFLGKNDISSVTYARHVDHIVQLVGPAHVSIALDYVFDSAELEEYMRTMRHTFPPNLGYELGARFVAPEQLEEIVATLQGWGYGDEDLAAILGGNLTRLANLIWKESRSATSL
ncbi:MAG: dipeptidase [Betaproteobacteria bacterium]